MSHADRNNLIRQIATRYGTTLEMVCGPGKKRIESQARREAAREFRRLGLSFPEIGIIFHRHHTTIMQLVGDRWDRKAKYLGEKEGEA